MCHFDSILLFHFKMIIKVKRFFFQAKICACKEDKCNNGELLKIPITTTQSPVIPQTVKNPLITPAPYTIHYLFFRNKFRFIQPLSSVVQTTQSAMPTVIFSTPGVLVSMGTIGTPGESGNQGFTTQPDYDDSQENLNDMLKSTTECFVVGKGQNCSSVSGKAKANSITHLLFFIMFVLLLNL